VKKVKNVLKLMFLGEVKMRDGEGEEKFKQGPGVQC
jgi:hypothetical protein